MPGPRSTTRSSTRPPAVEPSTRTGASAELNARAFDDQVRDGPLEQRGVDVDARQVLGHVDHDVVAASGQARERPQHHLVEADPARREAQHAALDAAHVEQVAHQVGEPVGLLLDRREELVTLRVGPVDVALAQRARRRP